MYMLALDGTILFASWFQVMHFILLLLIDNIAWVVDEEVNSRNYAFKFRRWDVQCFIKIYSISSNLTSFSKIYKWSIHKSELIIRTRFNTIRSSEIQSCNQLAQKLWH